MNWGFRLVTTGDNCLYWKKILKFKRLSCPICIFSWRFFETLYLKKCYQDSLIWYKMIDPTDLWAPSASASKRTLSGWAAAKLCSGLGRASAPLTSKLVQKWCMSLPWEKGQGQGRCNPQRLALGCPDPLPHSWAGLGTSLTEGSVGPQLLPGSFFM